MAFRRELLAKGQKVLHDAVVDDHHFAPAVHVGVGIARAGRPMGSPAGMADADVPTHRAFGQHPLQVSELPHVAADLDAPVLHDGQPCRVVAAIFQATKPLGDNGRSITRPDVAYDSTH